MVYPIGKPANATVHSAVLDYLNLNRHKFDQHGNFDPTPSQEDHMPRVLARYSVKPPKLPPSLANILRQVKKRQTEIEQFHKDRRDTANEGHKYDTDDCNDYYYNHMEYRCKRDFKDNPYVPGEYYKCIARAKALRDYCLRHHVFPEGLMEWGEADMDIVKDKDKSKKRNTDPNPEQEPEPDPQGNPYIFGPPQGAPAIYRAPLMPPELQRKSLQEMQFHMPSQETMPSAQASWATSQFGRSLAPLVEGSQPEEASDFERLLPLVPYFARALNGIRVTPGMGAGRIGGSNRVKSGFPRNVADPLFSGGIIY